MAGYGVGVLALLLLIVAPSAEARAFFVFGDSLVDNGNNDYLATTARADSPPYGIDYPTHRPTGRFSNGLSIPDIISKFELIVRLYKFELIDLYYVMLVMLVTFFFFGIF